jgi:hypothetical protein
MKFAVTTLVETFEKNPALLQLMSDGFGGHARIAAVCSTNVKVSLALVFLLTLTLLYRVLWLQNEGIS